MKDSIRKSAEMLAKFRRLLFLTAMSLAAPVFSAEIHSPQVTVVRDLYQAFAYEAVLEESAAAGLIEQPRDVLLRYFTPGLADLLLRDQQCTISTHEICRLDFLPLWGSQDPAGATVLVKPGTSVNSVVAVLHYPSTQMELTFYVTQTKAGWRIQDIAYDGGRFSLKETLGSKPSK